MACSWSKVNYSTAAVTKIRKTLDLYKKLEKEIDHSAGPVLMVRFQYAQTDSRWQELKRGLQHNFMMLIFKDGHYKKKLSNDVHRGFKRWCFNAR